MDAYIIPGLIGLILLLLGAVGTLVIIIWKWLGNWMVRLANSDEKQAESLTRIETRMENLDEVKKKQDHDHQEVREISKTLADHENRIKNLERELHGIRKYCESVHGERL